MELEKFDRQLRLMVLLTQNRTLSVEDISRELQMSRRSIYRYIDTFKQMGFVVCKEGTRYRIDHTSPFFKEITDRIHFSEVEAMTINQVLNSVLDNSPQVRHLREKLASLYDYKVLARHGVDDRVAHNLSTLYTAIQTERVVVLKDYNSPSSGKVSDRVVEPYLFLTGNSEVRCYEIGSGTNKTFKLARAQSVEILDLQWSYKERHTPLYVDLFHFSGEARLPVKLLLGSLATSVLLEEYPDAGRFLSPHGDGRNLFSLEVCSYKGIGRFVLGLYDDIEILGSPEFCEYLHSRIRDLTLKIGV